jgi:UDP-N-acetylglucosamine 2-epimerase (hydrolysing)
MFSNDLPAIETVKAYYEIEFNNYAMAMYHPVTTEMDGLKDRVDQFVEALIDSNKNYVVIFPNNDLGSKIILESFQKFELNPRFRVFPSVRFEYFLTLLKKANFIIGNSSAGVREAPYYGVPTINVGSRQMNRANSSEIINVVCNKVHLLDAIQNIPDKKTGFSKPFGNGNSAQLFVASLESEELWATNHQKQFKDAF